MILWFLKEINYRLHSLIVLEHTIPIFDVGAFFFRPTYSFITLCVFFV